MTIKTLLATSAILVASASATLAECNWSKQQASISCAAGTVYDADSGSCKAVTG